MNNPPVEPLQMTTNSLPRNNAGNSQSPSMTLMESLQHSSETMNPVTLMEEAFDNGKYSESLRIGRDAMRAALSRIAELEGEVARLERELIQKDNDAMSLSIKTDAVIVKCDKALGFCCAHMDDCWQREEAEEALSLISSFKGGEG